MLDFDKQATTTYDNNGHGRNQNDTRSDQMGQKEKEERYRQNNMLSIVRVISKNNLRWFVRVTRREEQSMLRVVMRLKMKLKRSRGRPRQRWLDKIDNHLEGRNTCLKEIIERNCFENRQYV